MQLNTMSIRAHAELVIPTDVGDFVTALGKDLTVKGRF